MEPMTPAGPSTAPVSGPAANARRLRTMVAASSFLFIPLAGLIALGAIGTIVRGAVGPMLLGMVALGGSTYLTSLSLARLRQPRSAWLAAPRWPFWVQVGLSLAFAVSVATVADPTGWALTVGCAVALAVIGIAPLIGARQLGVCCGALLALLLIVATVVAGVTGRPIWLAAIGAVGMGSSVVAMVAAAWSNGWMVRVVDELEAARTQAAELAVAQERLRMARDLHDLIGRTMTTVAVKSQLASALVAHGRTEQALAELESVRTIAEEAGQQVRGIAAGPREVELGQELQGARALLTSAGIGCEVDLRVEPGSLPPEVSGGLGWVLREGVTNVIRHSDARLVRVLLERDGDSAVLVIANDGVRTDEAGRGSGLDGLTVRLARLRGRLEHAYDDGSFVLTASVPWGRGSR